MKSKWRKILVLAMLATCLSANLCSFADDTESRKLSVLQVDGEETYVMKKAPRRLTAVAGMNLGEGNQVSTGKASSIYIEADDDKTLKLDSNTVVDVEKASAKSLKLTLQKGKLFFNVEKPLGEDEELQFKAAHTSMSIRGTSGIFMLSPETLIFYLIEGDVSWDLGNGQNLELHAGQKAELMRDWGNDIPGPGSDAKYVLKTNGTFHWTELDVTLLKIVLENRDHLDLSAIGLDSQEELERAESIVEEQERLNQTVGEPSYAEDDDEDDEEEERPPYDDKEPIPPEEEDVIPPDEDLPPEEEVVPPDEETPPEEEIVPPDEETPPEEEVVPPDEELPSEEEGLPDKEIPADEEVNSDGVSQ
ncbi:MAG: FecR domain-containing protein [Fusicatenibacter sp.]|nr:FecR domain-containing protein [Fusicatenibacter sp.]